MNTVSVFKYLKKIKNAVFQTSFTFSSSSEFVKQNGT